MEARLLQRELMELTARVLEEGVLDKQFLEIQTLRDEDNPNFPAEVVALFFEDAQKLINELTKALQQGQNYVDFGKIGADAHQLKGSSASVGAKRITDLCIAFRGFCDQLNVEGCCGCLQQLHYEFSLTKNKLESIFKLEKQILAGGGMLPGM
ncbi:Histidine-containing phosphotransfer protein 5 [Zostera marina]|uniref:Histidine-containing phosphotransfer protein n=1 Tax=Zostera marina TaxID=29655 RepID=A0A0K9P445_ZOSMR|nr:Histidine-containing phosphotransfer protein 5 [Zostera marina]